MQPHRQLLLETVKYRAVLKRTQQSRHWKVSRKERQLVLVKCQVWCHYTLDVYLMVQKCNAYWCDLDNTSLLSHKMKTLFPMIYLPPEGLLPGNSWKGLCHRHLHLTAVPVSCLLACHRCELNGLQKQFFLFGY